MKRFGKRFCTFCGGYVIYYNDNNYIYGECECGNVDYCDNETEEDVKKRFGSRFIEIK